MIGWNKCNPRLQKKKSRTGTRENAQPITRAKHVSGQGRKSTPKKYFCLTRCRPHCLDALWIEWRVYAHAAQRSWSVVLASRLALALGIYINKRTNVNLVRECSQRWLDFQLWFLCTLIEYILPLNHWTLFFAKLFNYYGNNQKTGRLLYPGLLCFMSSILTSWNACARIVNLYMGGVAGDPILPLETNKTLYNKQVVRSLLVLKDTQNRSQCTREAV